jgi:hypothetical protein
LPHEGYIAAVISKRAAKKLRSFAIHSKIFCHHVTIAYAPTDEIYAKYAHLVGKRIAFTITGICSNNKGQAAAVRDVPSENHHPHITISCAVGVPPVYSNDLLSGKRVRKKRYRQKAYATVRFIPI